MTKAAITFRDMESSPNLEAKIEEWTEALGELYDKLIRVEVVVGAERKRGRKGARYNVSVKLEIPGKDLVVSHKHGGDETHEDAHVAVRNSFRAARRQLVDHLETHVHRARHRGERTA